MRHEETRRLAAGVMSGALVFVLVACGDGAGAGADDPRVDDLTLDVSSMEFQVPGGILEVRASPNPYVGEVTDELFVGVSFPGDVGPGEEVTVYLCDDEHGEWLSGELDAEGALTLEGEETTVELRLADGGVSGTVAWRGGPDLPFTASSAAGEAGLYWAQDTFDDVHHWAGWVVLPDGRQRGVFVLCPPFPFQYCLIQN
jgi:hypothetical protein